MAIIDLVQWTPQSGETIYAWRFPHMNLSTFTQLIVHESQEAILFSKGQILQKFGPGKHTLSTENIPLLRSLFGLPFGGKNPFTAEVWFVNKTTPFNIDWQTSNMSIHDVDYNTQLPLKAVGRYGLKITDAEKFLIKIVGTKEKFTEYDLTDQFYGEFCTKTKSSILQFMLKHRIGYKSISAYLDQLSEYLKGTMLSFWDNLGLSMMQFNITDITIDTSTANGQKIADAIAKQSEMSITGHTWQQEQMFGVANNAIDGINGMMSNNSSGGLIGGLMAINMMGGLGGGSNGMGGAAGSMMEPGYKGPSFGGDNSNPAMGGCGTYSGQDVKMVYCSNCSKKFPSNVQFCPHCGDHYNPCPKCGTDNAENARRCISCGSPLISGATSGATCPECNAPIQPGATFCCNCGKQLGGSAVCSRCGSQLPISVKFCPKCGQKR